MSPSGVSISSVVRLILGLRKAFPFPLVVVSAVETAQPLEKVPAKTNWPDLPGQRPRPLEDGIGHRRRQLAGEGVLLAGVVTAEKSPASDLGLGTVAEFGPR